MLFYLFFLLFIIILIGRYNIYGYKILPERIAYPYVELFIIVLAVLRFDVGFDWSGYYQLINDKYVIQEVMRFERIPRFLLNIAYSNKSPLLFFIMIGVPTYCLIFRAVKENSISRYESLLIYICMFFLESFSTVRQWLAMAILLYAFKYIRKRKILPYMFFAVIAFFCHKSSILGAIFVYFIYNFGELKVFYPVCAILVIAGKKILNILGDTGLLGSYSYYLKVFNTFQNQGGDKIKYLFLILWIACYFLHRKIIKKEYIKKLLRICFFGLIFPFVLGGHLGQRIGVYFSIYFIFLIPEILNGNSFAKKYRFYIMIPFYMYFFLSLYINSHGSGAAYIPYRFYPIEKVFSEKPNIRK
ncbi:MAG: EpsG family protein [Treponema sp.]|nr:EpsG family protein [Treponema sp.]